LRFLSMRKKLVKLTTEELFELKWLTGTLLCLLAFWALSSLDLQAEFHILLGGLALVIALFKPIWVSRIPTFFWRSVGFVLLFIIGADFILHLPEFMPPLLRMVILLLIYRALAPRRRREDLQIVLLCLFCLVISGVMTLSLLFAFQILLFTPVAMGVLFLICVLDRGPESRQYQADWKAFSLSHLIGRVLRSLDYRVLFLGATMFLFVVSVSTVLFVLTPRVDIHQAIPYLEIKSEAKAGFSENVKLGEVSEIQSNNSVAMRIDAPSIDAIEGRPYWRILTLDKYDRGYFRMSNALKGRPMRAYPKTRELMGRDLLDGGQEVSRRFTEKWTFYLEGGTSQFLPLPGLFHSMRFEGVQNLAIIPGPHHVGLLSVQQRVFSYQIEDLRWTHRFPAMADEVEAFSSLTKPFSAAEYTYPLTTLELDMSDEDRAFLNELNAEIKGEAASLDVSSYSNLLTSYLWKSYRYSLYPDIGGEGEDAIVNWLRTAKAGHCEYFAGSFILLAREAGYPARMAVGFTGGAWNMVEEYFVVRNDDAHAWVEIYDAANEEWLRVDPTPGSGSANPDVIMPSSQNFEAGLGAWTDSLRIQWYRRVVNFDQGDQLDMAITMKDIFDDIAGKLGEKASDLGTRLSVWWKQPFSGKGILGMALVVSLLVAMWGLWHARFYWIGIFYRLLRRPKALDPLRLEASRYLRKFKRKELGGAIRSDLQAIRFGPPANRTTAKAVFKCARNALKG